MMLTTPPTASEPYKTDAPSLSTSIRSIIESGMVLTSTAAPLLKAELPNLRPFNKTRVERLRMATLASPNPPLRSEEHTSELQSRFDLVCRLLLESYADLRHPHSFPTRRSSDLTVQDRRAILEHFDPFNHRKRYGVDIDCSTVAEGRIA